MKRFFFLMCLLLITAFALATVMVHHDSPIFIFSDRDTEITLEIRSGYHNIERAHVYYRETGTANYQKMEMDIGTETNPVCRVWLRDVKLYLSGMDYYFEITQKDGSSKTLPEIQPAVNPYRATVKSDDTFEGFIVLAPDKDHSDLRKDFLIAISTFAIADQLQEESIQLIVNGRDVTKASDISQNMILYQPARLAHGMVTFYVKATLKNGKEIQSPRWQSMFRGGKESVFADMPFEIAGQAVLSHNGYQKTAGDSQNDDSDNRTSLNLDVHSRYDWLRFKSNLYISSMEDKDRQPINRYSFQFNVPYFQLGFGDETPAMGSFVASGRNVRGIHTKLNLRYMRILFSAGYSNRVVKGKETTKYYTEITETDTTYIPYEIYEGSTFKRNSLAARIELGSLTGFTYGISFAKNKDDIGSLDEKYYLNPVSEERNGEYDKDNPLVRPADNVILGMHGDFRFLENRLIFGAEGAMSLYNSNIIGGAIPKDELEEDLDESIPFDPEAIESIFIINKNVEPILPNKSSLAYKAYARAYFYRNLLDISYSAVGSSFHSLSTTYLPRDTGILSIVDNITLLNNTLSLNAGINLITDNIYDQKDITTSSTVLFANVSYFPRTYPSVRFGFTTNNSKNDWDDEETENNAGDEAENGSFENEFDVVTNSFYVNFGYQLGHLPVAPTTINIGYNTNMSQDKAYETYENKRHTFSFSARSFFKELPLTTQLALSISTSEDMRLDPDEETAEKDDFMITENYHFSSVYLKAEYLLLDNKLKPFFDYRFTTYGGDIDKQISNMFNIGAGYGAFANTFLSTDFGIRTYNNSDKDGVEFTNYSWRFRLSQRF